MNNSLLAQKLQRKGHSVGGFWGVLIVLDI